MIASFEVGGKNLQGARERTDGTCGYSNSAGTCDGKHYPFECPRAFSDTYPGKTMPGWTEKGERVGRMWNGDEITPECQKQWQYMQNGKWFTKFAFKAGKQARPFAYV